VIVIDASAFVAIVEEEDGFERLVRTLVAFDARRISPVSFVEVALILARRHKSPIELADRYLRQAAIELHPIDSDQANWARRAHLTYGKGRHPARLNLGDCFSYAAAKALDAPLLYVGGDFARTDVRTA
jgi:ribonuclease VapC